MGLQISQGRITNIALASMAVLLLVVSLFTMLLSMRQANAERAFVPIENMTQVSTAGGLSCGLSDGKVYCWGSSFLGDGIDYQDSPRAVLVSGALAGKTASKVSVSEGYACAIADSKVYCWGYNHSGQLGDGTNTDRAIPVAVDTTGALAGKFVTDIVTSSYKGACAIADGGLYCWGNQTGIVSPVAIGDPGALAGKTVTEVSIGVDATCVLADGSVYCWGYGYNGALGTGTHVSQTAPVAVDTSGVLASKTVTKVVTNDSYTCAIADGQLYCWGSNYYNSNGSIIENTLVPVAVDPTGVLSGKVITDISLGTSDSHNGSACVVADGKLYCWGYNKYGQIGTGSTDNVAVPIDVGASGVLAGKTVTQVIHSGLSTCAIADGQTYCWGYSQNGSLGNGDDEGRLVPTAVGTSGALADKAVTQMSSAGFSTCVIADGLPFCWGQAGAGFGEPGYPDDYQSMIPVQIQLFDGYVPEIASVSQQNVPVGVTGTTISIDGVDFDSDATVTIGGVPADVVDRQGSQQLSVTVPVSNAEGDAVDVTVTNSNGRSDTLSNALTYIKFIPKISWINQSRIPINDATYTISIAGEGFDSGATVEIGGKLAEVLSRYGDESIDVSVPESSTAGYVDIKVTNSDGQSNTLAGGLEYFDFVPHIDYTNPRVLPVNSASEVVNINGKGFDDTATVEIGGAVVEIRDRYGDSRITVIAPESSIGGTVDVKVTNGNGKTTTLKNGLTYDDGSVVILGISPSSILVGKQGYAYISGRNFDSGTTVTIGGEPAGVLARYGNTNLDVTIPASTAHGSVDVVVTNSDGSSATLENGFTYKGPTPHVINSIQFSESGGKKFLTVTGTGLVGEDDPAEYNDAIQPPFRSFVSLNGALLNWCTDGLPAGYDAATLAGMGIPTATDDPPCYYLLDSDLYTPLITPTTAKIWLSNEFDITAPGSVSVNGSADFAFNAPSGGGDDGTTTPPVYIQPTAKVDDKPLTGVPTIPKRPSFSGMATPESTVTVTVRSDPVSCTATADEQGNWECVLPADLEPGQHTVYIHVVNPDNSTEDLGPYTVTVAGAPIAITQGTQGNVTISAPNTGFGKLTVPLWSVFATGAVLLIGLATGVVRVYRMRARAVAFRR